MYPQTQQALAARQIDNYLLTSLWSSGVQARLSMPVPFKTKYSSCLVASTRGEEFGALPLFEKRR